MGDDQVPTVRRRREPPGFRRLAVRRVERPSPRLVRVTLGGPELDGFIVEQPAASVRLLLPSPGTGELVLPGWNGNEFLLAEGRRPTIRTFTPLRVDPDRLELDLEIVVHDGGGAASGWAEAAAPGDEAALSGPGRGYAADPAASAFLLAGDETAIPAISQLLECLSPEATVVVHVEMADPAARRALPEHPRGSVTWWDRSSGGPPGSAVVEAVRSASIAVGTRVWAAGEAAAMQRIRRHLFEERGLPRSEVHVRGYWKPERPGGADDD